MHRDNDINSISQRLALAVDFLKKNGYARYDTDIARKVGVKYSALCMAMKGTRTPSWEMLLNFCDHYPISFWWLRNGEGDMIGDGNRIVSLLQEIKELEKRLGL